MSICRPATAIGVTCVAGILAACAHRSLATGVADVSAEVHRRVGQSIPLQPDRACEERISHLLSDGLSLEDAIRITLANNHLLRAEYQDLAIARADVVQACLAQNPGFDVNPRFVVDGPGEIIDVGLIQPVVDFLLIPMRRQVAAADLRATRARLVAAGLRAAGATRRAYYDFLAAAEIVEVHSGVVLAAYASSEAGAAMREAGNIAAMDANRERAYYEESRNGLSQAQFERYAARERLNERMGLAHAANDWQLVPRLPDIPEELSIPRDSEAISIAHSRDLVASSARLRALAKRLGLERTGSVLRAVDLGVAAERDNGDWNVGPAVRIELPIFDYGQASVPRARAQICKAMELHLGLAARVRIRSRIAAQEVGSAHRRAVHLRGTVLPLRQQIVDQAQQQFNAMQIGVFELIQAKQDLVNAGMMFVSAARDYWRAQAMLDQIRAGAIDDPPAWGQ